ncbi:toxin glutamine deamidase domain-containing protein [Streptomyces sp. NPDC046977]|uniref:toxin glutamine deamidase domain-containing protein n=1 Tax=Streptomyces sp. NPDC046977 TaxID=3154703 RepID=UPI0033D0D66D
MPTSFDDSQIRDLGNQWINTGLKLHEYLTTMDGSVQSMGGGWTGKAGRAAQVVWSGVARHNIRHAIWDAGEVAQEIGKAIIEYADELQKAIKEINRAHLIEALSTIFGLVLGIASFGIGGLLGRLTQLVGELVESVMLGISRIASAAAAIGRAAAFTADTALNAVTTLGTDVLANFMGSKAAHAPFEMDWAGEGINIGLSVWMGWGMGGIDILKAPHNLANGGAIPHLSTPTTTPTPTPVNSSIPNSSVVPRTGLPSVGDLTAFPSNSVFQTNHAPPTNAGVTNPVTGTPRPNAGLPGNATPLPGNVRPTTGGPGGERPGTTRPPTPAPGSDVNTSAGPVTTRGGGQLSNLVRNDTTPTTGTPNAFLDGPPRSTRGVPGETTTPPAAHQNATGGRGGGGDVEVRNEIPPSTAVPHSGGVRENVLPSNGVPTRAGGARDDAPATTTSHADDGGETVRPDTATSHAAGPESVHAVDAVAGAGAGVGRGTPSAGHGAGSATEGGRGTGAPGRGANAPEGAVPRPEAQPSVIAGGGTTPSAGHGAGSATEGVRGTGAPGRGANAPEGAVPRPEAQPSAGAGRGADVPPSGARPGGPETSGVTRSTHDAPQPSRSVGGGDSRRPAEPHGGKAEADDTVTRSQTSADAEDTAGAGRSGDSLASSASETPATRQHDVGSGTNAGVGAHDGAHDGGRAVETAHGPGDRPGHDADTVLARDDAASTDSGAPGRQSAHTPAPEGRGKVAEWNAFKQEQDARNLPVVEAEARLEYHRQDLDSAWGKAHDTFAENDLFGGSHLARDGREAQNAKWRWRNDITREFRAEVDRTGHVSSDASTRIVDRARNNAYKYLVRADENERFTARFKEQLDAYKANRYGEGGDLPQFDGLSSKYVLDRDLQTYVKDDSKAYGYPDDGVQGPVAKLKDGADGSRPEDFTFVEHTFGDGASVDHFRDKTHDFNVLEQYYIGKHEELNRILDGFVRDGDTSGQLPAHTGWQIDRLLDGVFDDIGSIATRERDIRVGTGEKFDDLIKWSSRGAEALPDDFVQQVRLDFQRDLRAQYDLVFRYGDGDGPRALWDLTTTRAIDELPGRIAREHFIRGRLAEESLHVQDRFADLDEEFLAHFGEDGRQRVIGEYLDSVRSTAGRHFTDRWGDTPKTGDSAPQWTDVRDDLRSTLPDRIRHEGDLQAVVGESAHAFHEILGHPGSTESFQLHEDTVSRLGNDFRTERVVKYDQLFAPEGHKTHAWLSHESRHEDAFQSRLGDLRDGDYYSDLSSLSYPAFRDWRADVPARGQSVPGRPAPEGHASAPEGHTPAPGDDVDVPVPLREHTGGLQETPAVPTSQNHQGPAGSQTRTQTDHTPQRQDQVQVQVTPERDTAGSLGALSHTDATVPTSVSATSHRPGEQGRGRAQSSGQDDSPALDLAGEVHRWLRSSYEHTFTRTQIDDVHQELLQARPGLADLSVKMQAALVSQSLVRSMGQTVRAATDLLMRYTGVYPDSRRIQEVHRQLSEQFGTEFRQLTPVKQAEVVVAHMLGRLPGLHDAAADVSQGSVRAPFDRSTPDTVLPRVDGDETMPVPPETVHDSAGGGVVHTAGDLDGVTALPRTGRFGDEEVSLHESDSLPSNTVDKGKDMDRGPAAASVELDHDQHDFGQAVHEARAEEPLLNGLTDDEVRDAIRIQDRTDPAIPGMPQRGRMRDLGRIGQELHEHGLDAARDLAERLSGHGHRPGMRGGVNDETAAASATQSGDQAHTTHASPVTDHSAPEVLLSVDPRTFLQGNVLSMDMAHGLEIHAGGLGAADRQHFFDALDVLPGREGHLSEHRFVLVERGVDTSGKPVFAIAPAVEWYVQRYGAERFGFQEGTSLPAVRPDGDYVNAAFVPYLTRGAQDYTNTVGHTEVLREPGLSDPRLVVTPTMNGCAYAVTPHADADRMTVWHYQSPDSKMPFPVQFRREQRPTDWYGAGEYAGAIPQGRLFEVANLMWHGSNGWEFLSQENHTGSKDGGVVTLANVHGRRVDTLSGNELQHTATAYQSLVHSELHDWDLPQAMRNIEGVTPAGPDLERLREVHSRIKQHINSEIARLGQARDLNELRALADTFKGERAAMRGRLDKLIAEAGADAMSVRTDAGKQAVKVRRGHAVRMVDLFVNHPGKDWIELLRTESAPQHPSTLGGLYQSKARTELGSDQSTVNIAFRRIVDAKPKGPVERAVHEVMNQVRAEISKEIDQLGRAEDMVGLRALADRFGQQRETVRIVADAHYQALTHGVKDRKQVALFHEQVKGLLDGLVKPRMEDWISGLRHETDALMDGSAWHRMPGAEQHELGQRVQDLLPQGSREDGFFDLRTQRAYDELDTAALAQPLPARARQIADALYGGPQTTEVDDFFVRSVNSHLTGMGGTKVSPWKVHQAHRELQSSRGATFTRGNSVFRQEAIARHLAGRARNATIGGAPSMHVEPRNTTARAVPLDRGADRGTALTTESRRPEFIEGASTGRALAQDRAPGTAQGQTTALQSPAHGVRDAVPEGDLTDVLRERLNRPELLNKVHEGVKVGDRGLTDAQRAAFVLEHPELDLELAAALGRPDAGRDLAGQLRLSGPEKTELSMKLAAALGRPRFAEALDTPSMGHDLARAVGQKRLGGDLGAALQKRQQPRTRVVKQPGYATGDQFGIAAALMADPDLHVVVYTKIPGREAQDKGPGIAAFYRDSGIDSSRVHLVELAQGEKPDKAVNRALEQVYGRVPSAAERQRVSPVSEGTTWVADNFSLRVRHLVRAGWKLDEEGFSAEQRANLGDWLAQRGIEPSKDRDTIVLWSRFSGKKGDVHVEHDTSYQGVRDILGRLAPVKGETSGKGPLVVIAGDAYANPAHKGKYAEIVEEFRGKGLEVHNLTHFWDTDAAGKAALTSWGGNTRIGQMKLYEHLRMNSGSLRHLGFRSGNLEAMALAGHTVRYMEEPDSVGGARMAKWHAKNDSLLSAPPKNGKGGVGLSLATGYERLTVTAPPTRSGKFLVEKMALTKAQGVNNLHDALHPDWVYGAQKNHVKPPEVRTKFTKGFAAEDLDKITDYLTGARPKPVLRPQPTAAASGVSAVAQESRVPRNGHSSAPGRMQSSRSAPSQAAEAGGAATTRGGRTDRQEAIPQRSAQRGPQRGPGRTRDARVGTSRDAAASSSASGQRRLGAAGAGASALVRPHEELRSAYGWLEEVNPYREQGGGFETNCVLTAIAVDMTLRDGGVHQAPPSDPGAVRQNMGETSGLRNYLENYLDRDPDPVSGPQAVVAAMSAAPVGSRGMAVIEDAAGGIDHVVNVTRDHNGVVFLDGQAGFPVHAPDGAVSFLPTTEGIPGHPLYSENGTAMGGAPERTLGSARLAIIPEEKAPGPVREPERMAPRLPRLASIGVDLDERRPPRLDLQLPPAPLSTGPVRFSDGTELPPYMTGGVGSLLPDLPQDVVGRSFALGQGDHTLRGIDLVVRALGERLDQSAGSRPAPVKGSGAHDGFGLLDRVRHSLQNNPQGFFGDGATFVYEAGDGKTRILEVTARPYGNWERFTFGYANPAKVDTMQRSTTTSGRMDVNGTSVGFAPTAPLGPVKQLLSAWGRLHLQLNFGKQAQYNQQRQVVNQTETRTTDNSHVHLDDVRFDFVVKDSHGFPIELSGRPVPQGAARARRAVEFGFAVRDGLMVRIADSLTGGTDGESLPPRMKLGAESHFRTVSTEAFGPVRHINQWVMQQAGVRPDSMAAAQIERFFSTDGFHAMSRVLNSGPVYTPPLFGGRNGSDPLGVFSVRVESGDAVLISETTAAELRDIAQGTARTDRRIAKSYGAEVGVSVGPGFQLFGLENGAFDLRLLAGLTARYGASRSRRAGSGGSAAVKAAAQVKGATTGLYLVQKTVMVTAPPDTKAALPDAARDKEEQRGKLRKNSPQQWSEPPSSRTFQTWAVERLPHTEAHRLAGIGQVRPTGEAPKTPAYLTEADPSTLGMSRVEEFTFANGKISREIDGRKVTFPEYFADAVLKEVGKAYPDLVAPLRELNPRNPRWRDADHFQTVQHNTLEVLNQLSHHSMASNLETMMTTGLRIDLVESARLSRGHRYVWVDAKLTGRRYEGKQEDLRLRFSAPGTESLAGQQSGSRSLQGGLEGLVSVRDTATDHTGRTVQAGTASVGARVGLGKVSESGYGMGAAHEAMSIGTSDSHLYSYRISLDAQRGGYWRPRRWLRGLLLLNALGTQPFVFGEREHTLIRHPESGGTPEAPGLGRVLLSIPVEHTPVPAPARSDDQPKTETLSPPKAETLSPEDARNLALGTGQLPTWQASDAALLAHPHLTISVTGAKQLTGAVEEVLREASGGSWLVTRKGAPVHDAAVRITESSHLRANFDQSTAEAGWRAPELWAPAPYLNRSTWLVHRTSVSGGMTALTAAEKLETDTTIGGVTQVGGSNAKISTLFFGGQLGLWRVHHVGDGVTGSYTVALSPYRSDVSRSATVQRAAIAEISRQDTGRQVLVTAPVNHEIAAASDRIGAWAHGRSHLPASLVGASGRRLVVPNGWLGHLPEKSAYRLGVLKDGFGDVPLYTKRTWSPFPWLRDHPFGSWPVNSLHTAAALRGFEDRLKPLGLSAQDREQLRRLVSSRVVRAINKEMAGTGSSVPARIGRWGAEWAQTWIGHRQVRLRATLVPVKGSGDGFGGLGHSVDLQEHRQAVESVQLAHGRASGKLIGVASSESAHTADPVVTSAGPTYSQAGSSVQGSVQTRNDGTVEFSSISTTQAHAEYTTEYELRLEMEITDAEPANPAVAHSGAGRLKDTAGRWLRMWTGRRRHTISVQERAGQLIEHLPLSLMRPDADEGTRQVDSLEPRLPTQDRPPRQVPLPQSLGAGGWHDVRHRGAGAEVKPFEMPEMGFAVRAIVGLDGLHTANTLALGAAYDASLSVPDQGPLGADLLAQAKDTPLTRAGTGAAQSLEDGTSNGALTAFFHRTLTPEGYQVAGLADRGFFGGADGSLAIYSKPDFTGARLMAVADGMKFETPKRDVHGIGSSSSRVGAAEHILTAGPTTSSPAVGTSQIGSGSGSQEVDSVTIGPAGERLASVNVKPDKGRAFLFAIPAKWLSIAQVHHHVKDSTPVKAVRSAFGNPQREPQAMETDATVLAWVREDVARQLGLVDGVNFPTKVAESWDSVSKADKKWTAADKAYWDLRRGDAAKREAELAAAEEVLNTLTHGDPQPVPTVEDALEALHALERQDDWAEPAHDGWAQVLSEQIEQARTMLDRARQVAAAQDARDAAQQRLDEVKADLDAHLGYAEALSEEYARVRGLADRLTSWYQLQASPQGRDQIKDIPEPAKAVLSAPPAPEVRDKPETKPKTKQKAPATPAPKAARQDADVRQAHTSAPWLRQGATDQQRQFDAAADHRTLTVTEPDGSSRIFDLHQPQDDGNGFYAAVLKARGGRSGDSATLAGRVARSRHLPEGARLDPQAVFYSWELDAAVDRAFPYEPELRRRVRHSAASGGQLPKNVTRNLVRTNLRTARGWDAETADVAARLTAQTLEVDLTVVQEDGSHQSYSGASADTSDPLPQVTVYRRGDAYLAAVPRAAETWKGKGVDRSQLAELPDSGAVPQTEAHVGTYDEAVSEAIANEPALHGLTLDEVKTALDIQQRVDPPTPIIGHDVVAQASRERRMKALGQIARAVREDGVDAAKAMAKAKARELGENAGRRGLYAGGLQPTAAQDSVTAGETLKAQIARQTPVEPVERQWFDRFSRELARPVVRPNPTGTEPQPELVSVADTSHTESVEAMTQFAEAVGELTAAFSSRWAVQERIAGAGSSADAQSVDAHQQRLAAAESRFDAAERRMVELGLGDLSGRDDALLPDEMRDLPAPAFRVAMVRAEELLGAPAVAFGSERHVRVMRDAHAVARIAVAAQLVGGGEAAARAVAAEFSEQLGTHPGKMIGGALTVAGVNLTEQFRKATKELEEEYEHELRLLRSQLEWKTRQADAASSSSVVGRIWGVLGWRSPQLAGPQWDGESESDLQDEIAKLPDRMLRQQKKFLADQISAIERSLQQEHHSLALSAAERRAYAHDRDRIQKRLARLIVEPTGHRGYHAVLDAEVGKHPQFGAKRQQIKVDTYTDLARGLLGWIAAKPSRHQEKELALRVESEGHVEQLLDILIVRIHAHVRALPNGERMLGEMESGVSHVDGRELGTYLRHFRAKNLPEDLRHLATTVWERGGMAGVLRDPAGFGIRDKMMVLHDLMEYFKESRHYPVTYGTRRLPDDRREEEQSTTRVDEHGRRTSSTADRAQNRLDDGTTHPSTRDENAASTILARELRIPVWAGQSFTAMRMFKLAQWAGASQHEIAAVAWGIFAFWRLHYDHREELAYHTLHETLDIAQNFGVPYSLHDQAAGLRDVTVEHLLTYTEAQAADFAGLAMRVYRAVDALSSSGWVPTDMEEALEELRDAALYLTVHASVIGRDVGPARSLVGGGLTEPAIRDVIRLVDHVHKGLARQKEVAKHERVMRLGLDGGSRDHGLDPQAEGWETGREITIMAERHGLPERELEHLFAMPESGKGAEVFHAFSRPFLHSSRSYGYEVGSAGTVLLPDGRALRGRWTRFGDDFLHEQGYVLRGDNGWIGRVANWEELRAILPRDAVAYELAADESRMRVVPADGAGRAVVLPLTGERADAGVWTAGSEVHEPAEAVTQTDPVTAVKAAEQVDLLGVRSVSREADDGLLRSEGSRIVGGAGDGVARAAETSAPGEGGSLDELYGPAVQPKTVKRGEKDDAVPPQVRLNPLWYRVEDFKPALLERGGVWAYAIDEDGQFFIGSEDVWSIAGEEERKELFDAMRTAHPDLTMEQLKGYLNDQGVPTVAAGFDESGTTVIGSARVGGELFRDPITGQWTIDASSRYVGPAVRPGVEAATVSRWVRNAAEALSSALGMAIRARDAEQPTIAHGAHVAGTGTRKLDRDYGPLAGPKKVKDRERDHVALDQVRLNPLWYRLEDFKPALLERTDGVWHYAVDEDGRISIGSDQVLSVMTPEELDELWSHMRQADPELTLEQLKAGIDNQGHPTVAAGFREDGTTAVRPARVSGELSYDRASGAWELTDKSGRYMSNKIRPSVDAGEAQQWLANTARRMSEHLGVPVKPVLFKNAAAPAVTVPHEAAAVHTAGADKQADAHKPAEQVEAPAVSHAVDADQQAKAVDLLDPERFRAHTTDPAASGSRSFSRVVAFDRMLHDYQAIDEHDHAQRATALDGIVKQARSYVTTTKDEFRRQVVQQLVEQAETRAAAYRGQAEPKEAPAGTTEVSPTGPLGYRERIALAKREWQGPVAEEVARLEATLLEAGPGARSLVMGVVPGEQLWAVNVLGTVRWLEQSTAQATQPPQSAHATVVSIDLDPGARLIKPDARLLDAGDQTSRFCELVVGGDLRHVV